MDYLGDDREMMSDEDLQAPEGAEDIEMESDNQPKYARGGLTSEKARMILAHMSPEEIAELLNVQMAVSGRDQPKFDRNTGLMRFDGVEKALADPYLMEEGMKAHHAGGGSVSLHYAKGGHISKEDLVKMSKQGRHGDKRLVLLPKHVADVFDNIMGGKSINPHTGKREYWGLGSFLGGIGRAVMPLAGRAIRGIGSMLRRAPSTALRSAGQAARTMTGASSPREFMGQVGRGAMHGMRTAAQGMLSGQSPRQAMQSGFMAGAGQFDNPASRMIQAGAGHMFGGGSPYQAAMRGMAAGTQGMENPFARGMHQFSQGQMGGQGFGQSMMGGMQAGMAGMQNPFARGARGAISQMQVGRNPMQAMAYGMGRGMQGMQNPYAQAAQQGFEAFGRGQGFGGAMQAAGRRFFPR